MERSTALNPDLRNCSIKYESDKLYATENNHYTHKLTEIKLRTELGVTSYFVTKLRNILLL